MEQLEAKNREHKVCTDPKKRDTIEREILLLRLKRKEFELHRAQLAWQRDFIKSKEDNLPNRS